MCKQSYVDIESGTATHIDFWELPLHVITACLFLYLYIYKYVGHLPRKTMATQGI